VPYLSASAVVIHYEEALYQVYAPLPLPSRSSEPTRIDPPPMTSYERSIATMDLSRTISEINGDFSRKSQIFPTPVYFAPQMKGFTLELGIGARDQKLE